MKKKKLSPVGDIGTESYWQTIGRRFLRHRLGCVSLGVLILISLAALLAQCWLPMIEAIAGPLASLPAWNFGWERIR